MYVDEVREFALSLPQATEDFPFDQETLALRIGGKIFALLPLAGGTLAILGTILVAGWGKLAERPRQA